MNLKRIGLWGGSILLLAGMVYGLAQLASNPGSDTSGKLSEPVSGADHVQGNSLSKVTLVEYSDFECPACEQFQPVLKSLSQKYNRQVLFVFRHYPLPQHPSSVIAAKASEAASNQGKFWEMHDLLFENQKRWSGQNDVEKIFEGYATQLNLNLEKFLSDLNSDTTSNRVERDRNSGISSGVQATPTFFINGEKVTNLQTYADLENAIQRTLEQNN